MICVIELIGDRLANQSNGAQKKTAEIPRRKDSEDKRLANLITMFLTLPARKKCKQEILVSS